MVRASLSTLVRQEQAQSAALAPVVEVTWAAVSQTPVVNLHETDWRQERRRAWLWTVGDSTAITGLCTRGFWTILLISHCGRAARLPG